MSWKDLMDLVAVGQDEVDSLARRLGKAITVDRRALIMWAHKAIFQDDGEACMRSRVQDLIEDLVSRDPQATAYNYEYGPPKAKGQWAGTPEEKEERIMDKQNATPTAPLPWYDDRVEAVRKDAAPVAEAVEEPTRYTPKEIYDYLDRHVWKQNEAKKAASVITYNSLRGIRSTAMFIGPSGCGKTHVWRCLQKLFPGRIEILDISSLTQDGWKGALKWKDLLKSPIFRSGNHTILVMDEADKMLAPKYSGSENVSPSIQAEGLTLLEGSRVDVRIDSVIHSIDTSKISFVLCGAFSSKAHDVAEKSRGSRIGFGTAPKPVQPYARPLDEQDLIDFGVMPEFMGRIQRIVNLEPMTEDDYYRMTDSSLGFLSHIGEQYRADIRLTPEKRRELAALAARSGLGVRGMESQIRRLVDDVIFDHCEQRNFEF